MTEHVEVGGVEWNYNTAEAPDDRPLYLLERVGSVLVGWANGSTGGWAFYDCGASDGLNGYSGSARNTIVAWSPIPIPAPATPPKEPDVKQEFKVGEKVRRCDCNKPGTIIAMHKDHAWVELESGATELRRLCDLSAWTLPSPPDPYEAAAEEIGDYVNERFPSVSCGDISRADFADILRSHFPAYAEMRAVVEAANGLTLYPIEDGPYSRKNYVSSEKFDALTVALCAFRAKEAGK